MARHPDHRAPCFTARAVLAIVRGATRSPMSRTIGASLLALGASLVIPGTVLIAQTVKPGADARAAARADDAHERPPAAQSYRLSVDGVAVGTARQVAGLEAVGKEGSAPSGGEVTLTVPLDSAAIQRMYVWRKLVIDRGAREAGRLVELSALDASGQNVRRYTLRGAYLREATLPSLTSVRSASARLVIAYERADVR